MGLFDAMATSTMGVSAQSYALNNISGNIANASTAGFKGTDTSFADLLDQTGSGVRMTSRASTHVQGSVATSDVATNLAISGNGYFVVRQNTGSTDAPAFTGDTAYTRRGDFAPDANGYLANGAGNYLFAGPSASAPVRVSSADSASLASVSVANDGSLTATYGDGSTKSLGQVTLAQFGSQDGLEATDGGAYLATDRSGPPSFGLNGATLTAGSVEQSNVGISDQFSKMIETQQAYTANTKVLNASDEMLQDAITMYV
ncbi:flagellar hook basal-body protein [Methylobacterium sp. sgz302541]|uniref:flagellar hook basal-body protein n=1 Tax=unclassified Methylobacterium TaxID=2615210 RepID=UPI003D3382EF